MWRKSGEYNDIDHVSKMITGQQKLKTRQIRAMSESF